MAISEPPTPGGERRERPALCRSARSTIAKTAAISTALYSQPPSVFHGPFSACTWWIAEVITLCSAVPASGVATPAASSAPPPASGDAGRDRVLLARPQAERLEELAGASEPVPAEPAEELLGAVTDEEAADERAHEDMSDHVRCSCPRQPPETRAAIADMSGTIGVYGFSAATFHAGAARARTSASCSTSASAAACAARVRVGECGPAPGRARGRGDRLPPPEGARADHGAARSSSTPRTPAPASASARAWSSPPQYVARYIARDPRPGRRRARSSPRCRRTAAPPSSASSATREACHRSLIAARVAEEHGVEVTHLRP